MLTFLSKLWSINKWWFGSNDIEYILRHINLLSRNIMLMTLGNYDLANTWNTMCIAYNIKNHIHMMLHCKRNLSFPSASMQSTNQNVGLTSLIHIIVIMVIAIAMKPDSQLNYVKLSWLSLGVIFVTWISFF